MRKLKLASLLITLALSAAFQGIAIHHTATPNGKEYSYEQCREYHVGERNWADCGYNFLIQPSGRIDESRGFSRVGAHIKDRNREWLGVAFVGNGRANSAQVEAFGAWRHNAIERGWVGHELMPHYALGRTKCPGGVWDAIDGGGIK